MKETKEYEKDLASIRSMMERSVKFISLSGLSGVLAGIYALIGSFLAYKILYHDQLPAGYAFQYGDEGEAVFQLMSVGAVVLVLSITTAYVFSLRKAKKSGIPLWSNSSSQLLTDVSVPLVSGGILILVMISQGHFDFVSSSSLIFYGLALMAGGRHTFEEIRYLGLSEIVLGLLCAAWPGYGLIGWTIGFGILHIVYGAIMHYRYDR